MYTDLASRPQGRVGLGFGDIFTTHLQCSLVCINTRHCVGISSNIWREAALGHAHTVKQCVVGGEDLANFALEQAFLECQLHDTFEPVECQIESRTSSVPWEASRWDEFSSNLPFQTLSPG